MGDNTEVRITYETLFDMLRAEKNRHELQKLPSTFFKDLVAYLNEKRSIVEDSSKNQSLFAAEEKERAERQLANARKIIIELYEKREKKILETALDKARLNEQVISMSSFLEEEEKLFEQIAEILNLNRKQVLLNILEGKTPLQIEYGEQKEEKPKEFEEEYKEIESDFKKTEEFEEPEKSMNNLEGAGEAEEPRFKAAKTEKIIRFIHAVPRFIGKELEIYGPFEEEDIAKLPSEIASVLIYKGRAEEIEEN